MASAKQTAKSPEDLNVGAALDEVESESKVASGKTVAKYANSTFASRVKAAGKRVGSASNKAITADESDAK